MVKSSEFERVKDFFEINKKLVKLNQDNWNYHYHNCCEIIYPLKGEAEYFNNGQNYTVKPGQILFINSYELHKSEAADYNFERFIIMYREAVFESMPSIIMPDIFSILDERHYGTRLVSIPPELNKKLTGILTNIYERDLKSSIFSHAYRYSYFLLFLVNIADYLMTTETEYNNQIHYSNPRIKIIRAYIDANLGKALSLDGIAKHFNISKYYLCRLFKENTGLSIVDYINRMRMIYAERLINQGKYSFTEIANMTGFNNLTHFDRTFKKITGISPSSYKKGFSFKYDYQEE